MRFAEDLGRQRGVADALGRVSAPCEAAYKEGVTLPQPGRHAVIGALVLRRPRCPLSRASHRFALSRMFRQRIFAAFSPIPNGLIQAIMFARRDLRADIRMMPVDMLQYHVCPIRALQPNKAV